MGSRERRVREKESLRQQILDAARELFAAHGYRNVSMRKIAERIEYSPTTIYLYFNDKSELLFSLCEETFSILIDQFAELNREIADPVERLRLGLKSYVLFGLKHPNHYKVTFMDHPENIERTPESKLTDSKGMLAFRNISETVSCCVKDGRFRQVDVELASQALWAAIHGVTSLLIVHVKFPWADHEKVIDQVVNTMIEGLKA
jgi:AcrR family transcriptional regulator